MAEGSARSGVLTIVTPEGTALHFAVADHGARFTAFVLDLVAMLGLCMILVFVISLASAGGEGWSTAVFYLFFFLIRQFWFAFFEIRWHGQTPGKRSQGLRVVDARGGALRPEAVFARNLTRDLELFLPLMLLLAPEAIFPGVEGGARAAAALWGLVFALFPLFNKQHVRVGDLVAGTRVVRAPKARLLADLGTAAAAPAGKARARYEFTAEQLGHYGIFELQKLEEILRHDEARTIGAQEEVLDEIARRIRTRIGWVPVDKRQMFDPREFLKQFYAAQRAHLEQRALMGDRVSDKSAARGRKGVDRTRRPR